MNNSKATHTHTYNVGTRKAVQRQQLKMNKCNNNHMNGTHEATPGRNGSEGGREGGKEIGKKIHKQLQIIGGSLWDCFMTPQLQLLRLLPLLLPPLLKWLMFNIICTHIKHNTLCVCMCVRNLPVQMSIVHTLKSVYSHSPEHTHHTYIHIEFHSYTKLYMIL